MAVAGVIIAAIVLYVAVFAAALLVVHIYAREAEWLTVAAFLGVAAAVAIVTVGLLGPRLRHLGDAVVAAEALAGGRFDVRVPVTDDELAPLSSALNQAAASLGSLVASLQQERSQLNAILNASSDATVAVDSAATVVYINDAARALFGVASEGAAGRPFIEVVRDHDLNELVVAAARSGQRSVRVVTFGPTQRWLQATAVPITGGGEWAALAILHDLTEVRQLDSVRRDFITNVSHELRTPLAGIRAAAETLSEGALDDRPAAVEFLGHIEREVDRMTQMVEELLELSRIESGAAPMRFVQLDASQLVRDTAKRFGQQAERAGLAITAETAAEPLHIIADGEHLERALGNLVANAIKFTPEGGAVTLSARAEGAHAVIAVRDTGIGIEVEQKARVFERFYKADKGRGSGGTGLGLAIVKHIVRAHEGSVAVESMPGRGSTFTMQLPRR